ncbi:hypothetical protein RND71_008656 [Anisodus tanguticus]|uniref:Uncharacterized protein n=1 Tax=Anisodus tanguticus TaxID=243964 RepID=A0AAE1SNU0_9SOLA|nr:hypothetical protein RND71_008656 [Anisodus tanguticus]
MNSDKDGFKPRLYVSLKKRIAESPNSSVVTASLSVAANLRWASNTNGLASSIIDEDHCKSPMDNDIYEDPCEPLMDNDYPDNVHRDDLENPASSNHKLYAYYKVYEGNIVQIPHESKWMTPSHM